MKKILLFSAMALAAFPAYAAFVSTSITSDQSVQIAKVGSGAGNKDMYHACANIYGTFGSGTLSLRVSTDGGSTLVDMSDTTGVDVDLTAADQVCWSWGFSSSNTDDAIFYASMDGSTTPSVTVDVFDNR